MKKLSLLEYVLIGAMMVSILISGFLVVIRILYGVQHICYDAWIFGTNIALLLQIYDNHNAILNK